jgi:hypothetical protein
MFVYGPVISRTTVPNNGIGPYVGVDCIYLYVVAT